MTNLPVPIGPQMLWPQPVGGTALAQQGFFGGPPYWGQQALGASQPALGFQRPALPGPQGMPMLEALGAQGAAAPRGPIPMGQGPNIPSGPRIEPDWNAVRRAQWGDAKFANMRGATPPPAAAATGLRARDLLSLRGLGPAAVLGSGASEIYKGVTGQYTPTEEYAERFGVEPATDLMGWADVLGPAGMVTSAALGEGGMIGQRLLGIADDAMMGLPSKAARWLRGDEAPVDAISSAAPVVGDGQAPAPEAPQAPQPLWNQGVMPELPQGVSPDYTQMLQTLSGLGPQTPDTSLFDNPPQRGPVVRPDSTGRDAEIARLKNSPPERAAGMSTTDKIVQALGGLAAGALRGDGTLRGTLAESGPILVNQMLENVAVEQENDRAFKLAQQQHESLINQVTQEQADYEARLAQLDQDIAFGNETTRFNAQQEKQQVLQQAGEAQRGHQIKMAELGLRAQEAQADFTNRELDRQFEHRMMQYEANMPKVSMVDGQYVIQKVDPEGNVFLETKPIGQGSRNLKGLLALDKNENLSPTVSRKVQKMAEFEAAAQLGDATLMVDSLADDVLMSTPHLIPGYEQAAEQAREAAAGAGFLPGTEENDAAIRDTLTTYAAEQAMNPEILGQWAEVNPYAKALQGVMRGSAN